MDGQISIFDTVEPKLKIDKPIRLIELFAGIGAQAKPSIAGRAAPTL